MAAASPADQVALQQLVTAYAYAIDDRDFEALDGIFTADAHIDYRAVGGIQGSLAEVKAWLPQALAAFPAYMHFIGNFSFDVDGDAATGRVACLNPMVLPQKVDGVDTMILGLWYHDRYVRTAAGWRIRERIEKSAFNYNMPQAMKAQLGLR